MRINEVDEISLKSNFWIINYEKFMKFDIFKTQRIKTTFFSILSETSHFHSFDKISDNLCV